MEFLKYLKKIKLKKNAYDLFSNIYHDQTANDTFECSLDSLSFSENCDELFLNRFTRNAIATMFHDAGIIDRLEEKKISDFIIEFKKDDTLIHRLLIFYKKIMSPNLLIDLRLSEKKILPASCGTKPYPNLSQMNTLVLEWISTNDPKGSFSAKRPRLPGQINPGLGILSPLIRFITEIGEKLQKDCIVTMADHFHAAAMYSTDFRFLNPEQEGFLKAVLRDLGYHGLHDISWGFHTGTIIDRTRNVPVSYVPSLQVLSLSQEVTAFFKSKSYRDRCREVSENGSFYLDYTTMIQLKKNYLRK